MTKEDTLIAKASNHDVVKKKRAVRDPVSGSINKNFTLALAIQAGQSSWFDEGVISDQTLKATIGVMKGIKPRDELDGMLAAQLLGIHNAAMECFRRAMLAEQTSEFRQALLSQANKLTRSYATLLDTLTRYRNKGTSEQKVTVQHVHIHGGGQAIVGNVKQ